MTTRLILPVDGPFSLAAAASFGFGPNTGRPAPNDSLMRLAFVGGVQAADPGLRPVLFHSPYEAAAWSRCCRSGGTGRRRRRCAAGCAKQRA